MRVLHITNGDVAAAAMRAAGIRGDILPWRDVLHDGPIPAGLTLTQLADVRAQFIADCGWGDYRAVRADFAARDTVLASFRRYQRVVLWFEHDLYDQLQLVQILAWFARRPRGTTRVALIQAQDYLGPLAPELVAQLLSTQRPVSTAQLVLARATWVAVTAPDPRRLLRLLKRALNALPFLRPALLRLLEEYPEVEDGLSRTERGALCAVEAGAASPLEIFRAWQNYESPRFMGDSPFWQRLKGLTNAPTPALRTHDGAAFRVPAAGADAGFAAQRLQLTDSGCALLRREIDWVALNGIDRWVGGVHLARECWRWSALRQIVVRDPSELARRAVYSPI